VAAGAHQEEVEQDVRELAVEPPAGAAGELLERKDLQAGEVDGLERQLDRTASDFRRERQQASRKVQEAADAIRDSRLRDKIRYSRGLVQGAPPDQAATFEEQFIAKEIGETGVGSRVFVLEDSRCRQYLAGILDNCTRRDVLHVVVNVQMILVPV
jgi:hypothetical protein